MRRLFVLLLGLLVSMLPSGCGPPRFDSSTDEQAQASMEAMMNPMTESERETFAADMLTVARPEIDRGRARETMTIETTSLSYMYRSLQGMTAPEIRARAAEIRKSQPAKGPD
ncbi:MAG: hypothetical protein P4L84_03975 [Isosphaeraceae bacterium]|nr:hypothetical protein [Isosphaeraceae bacterium]